MRTILILPDGSEISSGVAGQRAIVSFELTKSVNAGKELTLGSCCAAMAQIGIYEQEQSVYAGDELQIFRTDGESTVCLGLFTAQQPTRSGGITKITAYDRVARLDQQVGDLLKELQWPMNLWELAQAVCQYCGVELAQDGDLNTDYSVERFTAADVTGRQVLQWVGQACGRFCCADAQGKLKFGWYAPKAVQITRGGAYYYYQNSLSMELYRVAAVEKVQICQSSTDVGVVWPNVTGKVNTYVIRGNPLLTGATTEKTEPVARMLYEQLSSVTYTPCRVTVQEQSGIGPGDIITVEGQTVYVMTVRLQSGRLELECSGSIDRNDTASVNQISYKALSGRVLELDTRVEGLSAENRDSTGRLARLALTVDGLSSRVSTGESVTDQRLTGLEQTAQALQVRVEQGAAQIKTVTGYTFDGDGLTIAKSGTEMVNRLDHTGMYVTRSGEVILQANNQGVTATDVQVRNYLNIGLHARLEDYAGRTACFYI